MNAAREALKYAVKPADMTADGGWLLDITRQLNKLRFIASGGVLKDTLGEREETNEDLLLRENSEGESTNAGTLVSHGSDQSGDTGACTGREKPTVCLAYFCFPDSTMAVITVSLTPALIRSVPNLCDDHFIAHPCRLQRNDIRIHQGPCLRSAPVFYWCGSRTWNAGTVLDLVGIQRLEHSDRV
jgi:hypothetical protein